MSSSHSTMMMQSRKVPGMMSGSVPRQQSTILLAKPQGSASGGDGTLPATSAVKIMRDDSQVKGKASHVSSLKLISESLEFTGDRLESLFFENSDYTVVGVLGVTGCGKSTIMNEIYGAITSSGGGGGGAGGGGGVPPFPVQSEENRLMARHCSVGVELRISPERLILLDTQPILSPSLLVDILRPDGSSSLSPFGNDHALSAELCVEILSIQLAVYLFSICHVVLLVTEGSGSISTWQLAQRIFMLKQGIPDPSLASFGPCSSATWPSLVLPNMPIGSHISHVAQSHHQGDSLVRGSSGNVMVSSSVGVGEREGDRKDKAMASPPLPPPPPPPPSSPHPSPPQVTPPPMLIEYCADLVFVHNKLRDDECSWKELCNLGRSLSEFMRSVDSSITSLSHSPSLHPCTSDLFRYMPLNSSPVPFDDVYDDDDDDDSLEDLAMAAEHGGGGRAQIQTATRRRGEGRRGGGKGSAVRSGYGGRLGSATKLSEKETGGRVVDERERKQSKEKVGGGGSSIKVPNYFAVPLKVGDVQQSHHHHHHHHHHHRYPINNPSQVNPHQSESYGVMMQRLRNEILHYPRRSFARQLTERDWLKSAGLIWDLVRKSPIIFEYSKMLQASGLYRR